MADEVPPPGPAHTWWNDVDGLVEGPVDVAFGRWWAFNGAQVCGFVRAYTAFVGARLLPEVRRVRRLIESSMAAENGPENAQLALNVINLEVFGLLMTIGDFRRDHRNAEFALDRLRDAPEFTRAQRRDYAEQIRVFERAEAGNRLLGTIADLLPERPSQMHEPEIIARLDACARRLEAWLAEDPHIVADLLL